MNTTKYMVRSYSVHASDGQPRLELTREVQVHRLTNAAILLAGPASALPSGAQLEAAKFFIRERGVYREIQPSDWVVEAHDMAEIAELGLA